jgi:uncharacterized protein YycO
MSALIRWQTRSVYSHAALVLPDGSLVEAWQGLGAGVRRKRLECWKGIDVFDIEGLDEKGSANIDLVACRWSEAGIRYDYWSVLRFLSRRKPSNNNRMFCSELVESIVRLATGKGLISDRIPEACIAPGHLAFSNRLIFNCSNERPKS